jgi:hypothetical protein
MQADTIRGCARSAASASRAAFESWNVSAAVEFEPMTSPRIDRSRTMRVRNVNTSWLKNAAHASSSATTLVDTMRSVSLCRTERSCSAFTR